LSLDTIQDSPNIKRNQDLNCHVNTKEIKKNFISANKNTNSLFLKQRNDKFINNFINTLDKTNLKSTGNLSNKSSAKIVSKPTSILDEK